MLKKNKEKNDANSQKGFGFFSKLGNYFNPEPQKERVLRHEDFNAAGDVFYASVSAGYKISQRIIVIALVLFLLFSLVTNFSQITYDNFFYLLKDFAAAAEVESTNYDTLSYTSDPRNFFALYRGGLTVANPSRISAYTATGRRTINASAQFSSPYIETSDKYFLIYDISGTTFAVYNSFARIYKEDVEYPVTGACFAKNGNLAVMTRDIDHKSVVHVYNDNFKKHFTVPSSSEYAFDVAMDSDANRLAITYWGIGDGTGRITVDVYDLSGKEISTISIDGEYVLSTGFISEGVFSVVTDRAVHLYDKSFDELDDYYSYGGGTVTGYSVNEHGVAVAYTLNSRNTVLAFDKSGNLVYNENISSNIKDIDLFGEYLFFRTDVGVIRVNRANLDEELLTSGQGEMLIYSDDTAIICGDSKAEYLVFGE